MQPRQVTSFRYKRPKSGSLLYNTIKDLIARFCQLDNKSQVEHIMYALRPAYWWYIDELQPKHAGGHLPSLTEYQFMHFALQIYYDKAFNGKKTNKMYGSFLKYVHSIPVCGVVLTRPLECKSEDKVSTVQLEILLVRSHGSPSWSVPKGKINNKESKAECASRELKEETGVQIDSKHLQKMVRSKRLHLFDCPLTHPLTVLKSPNKEIAEVNWFPVNSISNKLVKSQLRLVKQLVTLS